MGTLEGKYTFFFFLFLNRWILDSEMDTLAYDLWVQYTLWLYKRGSPKANETTIDILRGKYGNWGTERK